MDSIERQRTHFENISEKYYNARQNKNHLLIKKLIWDFFFSGFPLPVTENNSPLRVIEPMCGYAEGLTIVSERLSTAISYFGFDYSKSLVDLVNKEQPDLNVIQADVTKFEMPQDQEQFDLMILIGGLHHVYTNADKVVHNLSKIIKPGGYLINFEPTQNFLLARWVRNYLYKKNNLFDEETEQGFELDHLNEIYTKNNFSIIHQIYPGLLSYILYYNPDAFPLLNLGSEKLVRALFQVDRRLISKWLGKKLSFATLTLLQK